MSFVSDGCLHATSRVEPLMTELLFVRWGQTVKYVVEKTMLCVGLRSKPVSVAHRKQVSVFSRGEASARVCGCVHVRAVLVFACTTECHSSAMVRVWRLQRGLWRGLVRLVLAIPLFHVCAVSVVRIVWAQGCPAAFFVFFLLLVVRSVEEVASLAGWAGVRKNKQLFVTTKVNRGAERFPGRLTCVWLFNLFILHKKFVNLLEFSAFL